ncbi:hypothetical protein phiOC_p337 [Ochrobactrum phage vB_OspM_OC]|nr:hypothetical protein phiOC_p337 [Ochrobactrum phage vB_OspM_OC]
MVEIFLLFVFAHFLADYPLQGILATEKNPHKEKEIIPWKHAMFAHCFIHAGFVAIIVAIATGNHVLALGFGMMELSCHWLLDNAKCDKYITFNQDQLGHVLCKFFYSIVLSPYVGLFVFAGPLTFI